MKTPSLVGAKVKSVREITDKELEISGLEYHPYRNPVVIELDNGISIIPLRDEEGNSSGCQSGVYNGKSFYIDKE